jgi:1-acyl-sn-glycerol-3-phosphate acyltransferase
LVVFGSLILNSLLIVCCQIPSLLIYYGIPSWRRTYYRRYIRFTQRAWVESVSWLCYAFAPFDLFITGDEFPFIDPQTGKPEPVILLANHMVNADWIYVWFLAMHFGCHGDVKIIMKEELKRFPVFGLGMQFFEFIFLKRSWNHDQQRLAEAFDSIAKDRPALWLMIFPEGTLISDQTMEVNLQYAEKAGLTEIPQYQLLPRATGLEFCLRHLHPCLNAVYDITMAYEGARPQYPQDDYSIFSIFVESRPPPRVHMHIKRYPIEHFTRQVDMTSELKPAPSLNELRQAEVSLMMNEASSSNGAEASTSTTLFSSPSPTKRRSPSPMLRPVTMEEQRPRSASPMPTSFTIWLREFFMKKDQLLHTFYTTGAFPLGQRRQPFTIHVGDRSKGFWYGAFGNEMALPRLWLGVFLFLVLIFFSTSK